MSRTYEWLSAGQRDQIRRLLRLGFTIQEASGSRVVLQRRHRPPLLTVLVALAMALLSAALLLPYFLIHLIYYTLGRNSVCVIEREPLLRDGEG